MHIAVGHTIIAQPFSNIIYRNIVNTMQAKLHLQRKTFAKTTYIWSFWRDFSYHSLETVFLVQSSENNFNVSNLENNNLLAVLWNGCEITGRPLNLSLHCVDDPGSSLQRDESLPELYDSRLIFNVSQTVLYSGMYKMSKGLYLRLSRSEASALHSFLRYI